MTATHVKPTYRFPSQTMPAISYEKHLGDLQSFAAWIEDQGVRTENTRISRYVRYLRALVSGAEGARIFGEPTGGPILSDIDRLLYVLREAHELLWIRNGAMRNPPKGIGEKLRLIVGGTDFAALDVDTSARNAQFELRIASYFCRRGFQVDVSTETDIVASLAGKIFHVECKRVASEALLNRRIKEAGEQLKSRMPAGRFGQRHYGLVAIDVTKLAFVHNGLTFAMTEEHSRDTIRDKISAVAGQVKDASIFARKDNLLNWLQVHIPALIQYPPATATRFTSYFIGSSHAGGRRKRALNSLSSILEVSNLEDAEMPAESIRRATSITLPAGTTFAWDNELICHFVVNLELPEREISHEVLHLVMGSTEDRFSYYELQGVVASLTNDDRAALKGNIERAVAELACRLVLLRRPFETNSAA